MVGSWPGDAPRASGTTAALSFEGPAACLGGCCFARQIRSGRFVTLTDRGLGKKKGKNP